MTATERLAKLAEWIERDCREPDKVRAYASDLAATIQKARMEEEGALADRIEVALNEMDPHAPDTPNLIAWPQPNVRREFAEWLAARVRPADAVTPAPCKAKLYHGPGHQSSTLCRLTGEHEIHEAIYGGHTLARWRDGSYADQLRQKGIEVPYWVNEGTAMTGYFDEPPEVD